MSVAEVFCDDAHAADAASFLGEKAKSVEGAPRALAKTLEDVHLCVVKRTADEADIRAFFKGTK
jgi:cytosol alanyl aminopeptidase